MATELKCPQCGKKTLSCDYVGDVGEIDYWDEYEAYCSLCGFKKTELISGGSLKQNWVTKCPFCGQEHCGKIPYQSERR